MGIQEMSLSEREQSARQLYLRQLVRRAEGTLTPTPLKVEQEDTHKRIVAIGGGTGTGNILQILQGEGYTNLTGVIATTDDGMRTSRFGDYKEAIGTFKSELRTIGYADIIRVFEDLLPRTNALKGELTKPIDNAQFGLDGLWKGYPQFEALRQEYGGNLTKAMIDLSKAQGLNTLVLPMSDHPTDLALGLQSNQYISGAFSIAQYKPENIVDANPRAVLTPPAYANPLVRESITHAEKIILGPGDMLVSLGPNLQTGGIPEAIREAAKNGTELIYLLNYTTRGFDTKGWDATKFVEYTRERLGGDVPLTVVADVTPYPADVVEKLREKDSAPVTGKGALDTLPNTKVIYTQTLGGFGFNGQPIGDTVKMGSVLKKLL